MGITVEISGEYACFSRPELKVERVSYECITPSAVRGILEAVYWEPAIRWVIDEIQLCAPVKFENIRRNEVNSKVKDTSYRNYKKYLEERGKRAQLSFGEEEEEVGYRHEGYLFASGDRSQRAAMVLRDVRYVVKAHFEPNRLGERDVEADGSFKHGKFADIIKRRLRTGRQFHQPYLGTREFPARVRLIEDGDEAPKPIDETRSLGLMLYDIDYKKDKDGNVTAFVPQYFLAQLKHGVLDLRGAEVLQ